MTRSYHDLWPRVVSFNNLLAAFKAAARGKRSKGATAAFEYDLEENLLNLQEELRSGSYQPGAYTSFTIHDPKRRLISAAPFRDRVVHHALCRVIEPLFERQFIYDSYANQVGKGTHRALERCTQYLRRFAYVLPLDVVQFFPSIDHAILESILAKTIGDEQVMGLCRQIIASGRGVQAGQYDMAYFPGDDLFAIQRPRGLPIGNLTSQFWANVYLNGLDQFVKRELKCRGYIRYVDDLRLFADDKPSLHGWKAAIVDYLAGLRLSLHSENAQPRPGGIGLPFLGFQVWPDHRRLKRARVIHTRRKLKALAARYTAGQIGLDRLGASILAWCNHASYGDTHGLQKAMLAGLPIRAPVIQKGSA